MKVLKHLPNQEVIGSFLSKAREKHHARQEKLKLQASKPAPIVLRDAETEIEIERPTQAPYRNPKYFISYEENPDNARKLEDEDNHIGLAMIEDDSQRKFNKKVWDQKRRKFVGVTSDGLGQNLNVLSKKKKEMQESMKNISKKFRVWKNSNRVRIQKEGTQEDKDGALKAKDLFNDRRSQNFRKIKKKNTSRVDFGSVLKKKRAQSKQNLMNMEKGKRQKIQKSNNMKFKKATKGGSRAMGGRGPTGGKGGRGPMGGKGGKGGRGASKGKFSKRR